MSLPKWLTRVSHSAIKDYQSCPLLFYYRRVLEIKLPENPIDLYFGKAFHKGLELLEAKKSNPIEVFKKEFLPDGVENKLKFYQLRNKGTQLLEEYMQHHPYLEIKSTEKFITKENVVDPTTGTKLKFKQLSGVIDFSTTDNKLGDYKTASKPYKQSDVDKSLQPTMYYLLYYLEYGKLPDAFIYIVFLKKRKSNPIQVLVTHRTMKDITKLIVLMNSIYTKVEQNKFPRTHNEHQFCDCWKYEELLKV